jgi:CBS domain-containing protein
MNVATILKHKGSAVVTTAPETRFGEIAALLHEHNVGSIVVVDGEMNVVGIVSERDIVTCIARQTAAVLERPVGECMTRRVHTCTRADTLEKLMAEMTAHRFRHLPVVEIGRAHV